MEPPEPEDVDPLEPFRLRGIRDRCARPRVLVVLIAFVETSTDAGLFTVRKRRDFCARRGVDEPDDGPLRDDDRRRGDTTDERETFAGADHPFRPGVGVERVDAKARPRRRPRPTRPRAPRSRRTRTLRTNFRQALKKATGSQAWRRRAFRRGRRTNTPDAVKLSTKNRLRKGCSERRRRCMPACKRERR